MTVHYARFKVKSGFQGVLYRVEDGRRIPLCPDYNGLFYVPFGAPFYFVEDLGESIEVEICECRKLVDFRGLHPWIIPFNCNVKCDLVLIARRSPLFERIINEIYSGVEPCL